MKKKTAILISIILCISLMPVTAFADLEPKPSSINSIDQLKRAIAADLQDGNLSKQEKQRLLDSTEPEVADTFIEEKLERATEVLDGNELYAEMINLPGGNQYGHYSYDLGDGCMLEVELADRSEDSNTMIINTSVAVASSNNSNVWKAYGNRYFTAEATVKCQLGSVTLCLENHYALSADGIDERYGKAIWKMSSGQKIKVTFGKPVITDKSARTPGKSDVNMYCKYTIEGNISGRYTDLGEYKLNTSVKYLSHDKSGKRIKVGQTWSLSKVG